jgi:hypothetical protein
MKQALADRLRQTTFMDLFERLDYRAVDALWENGHSRDELERLATDATADLRSRFLVAEILFEKLPGYPPQEIASTLADIYAQVLRDSLAGTANAWGLPGMPEGQIAGHVLKLGDSAVRALMGLFEDRQPVAYEGSQEATYGNSFQFRVKDIAASLVARIRKVPFVPDRNPAARDKAIRELARALGA